MDVTPILESLNDAQRQAVTAPDEPLLVIAGAGSGKTRVLVHRAAWLIDVEGVSPQGLLAVTELLTDPALRARAGTERADLSALLDTRVRAFNEHALAAGLDYPRYESGFFVTVFAEDGDRTAAAMRDEGVFVVPMNGGVRVALCATPASEVPRLVGALRRGVDAASGGA